MLDLFSGKNKSAKEPLADLILDGLNDLNGILEIWIDDLQLGSGDVLDPEMEPDNESAFEAHLNCLDRILARAEVADLRFKLSKCFFAQFEVETLGMVAAVGCIKPDPKKTKAISVWPRPTRPEDVERFLATTVFIREHLSPQYSNVSKPLRE